MQQVTIEQDKDFVVLIFSSRGQDLTMAPDIAENLARVGLEMVKECEAWVESGGPRHVLKGEPMSCTRPKSWDGKVNIRFDRFADRVRLPYKAAKEIFEEMKAKAVEARYRFTIVDQRRAVNAA